MNPAPKVVTGSLHPDNKDACDWGYQGFIAYGCHAYIVIVDPKTLQVIQTLGQHKGNVCQVRWAREKYHHAFATGSAYSLYLASVDTGGTIIVWDVTNGQSRTEMESYRDTKPVTCMEWYVGQDESHDLLAVLRFPDVLELWDGYSGVKLWKKVFGEPVQAFAFNPFDISSLVLLCESKILVLPDFKPMSAPGDDFKVIQFVESAPVIRQGGPPSRRASSSSLRQSRSWSSKVISLAITIPSGLLGTSDISKKRQSVSSDEDTDYITRCLQIAFNPGHRHQLFLVFEREIMVLDLDLDISLGTIHLEKSMPSFVKIFPCRWTDVLFCLHENGSISTRIKRRGSIETSTSEHLTGQPSNRSQYDVLEVNYDLHCQSDALRLLRNSKVFTSVFNPVTEKTLGILLSDSKLILWDVISKDITKTTFEDKSMPRFSLSDLIRETHADQPKTKGRKSLQMVATGLLGGILSPVTAIAMLRSFIDSDNTGKILALGSDAGVVQLINVYSGQIRREYKLFMTPVKGLDCIDTISILAFTYTDPGSYGNRAVKNDILILHTDTGEVTDFRERNERKGAIVDVRVSPSKLFATVMYKDWPVEMWNIPNKRLMHTVDSNIDIPFSLVWYPYYQRITSDDDQDKKMERLFIGSLNGNLIKVNVIDDKRMEILEHVLTEPQPSKAVAVSDIICMDFKDTLLLSADKMSQLFLTIATQKKATKKIYDRVGCKIKAVKFAPGKETKKFLVIFDDRVDIWEVNTGTHGLEEMLTSSPKFTTLVIDGCWVGTETVGVVTADGCLHILSAVSRRSSEKKLEDGYVYIPELSMKRMKNPFTDWEVPEPIFSPALLESKAAFLLKYILQCGLMSRVEEGQTWPCQSATVSKQLNLIDRDILSYITSSDVPIPDRCLMVARLFGDECDTDFWRVAQYQISTGTVDKSLEQAFGFLKAKKFGAMEWFTHVTVPKSEINLLDIDHPEGQSHETRDLDISWMRDLDKVQPLETCFDLMMDENSFKAYQLSRLSLQNRKRGNYQEKRHCASRFVMLGVDDMAIQTLMETEADNEGFQNDCLKACLVSSLKSSSTSVSTVKLAATQLIAAGKLSDGLELLCLINKHLDACKYYMSFGMWQEAVWLAKVSLPKEECLSVMYRWAELLWTSNEKNKAILVMLSLGQYTTVLLMLFELKQFDRAALFLQACLTNKLLEKNLETGPFIEQIYLEFAKLLAVTRYKNAVDFYCDLAGQKGDNFRQDLKRIVNWS